MPTTTPIRDVMTTKVITLSPDQAFDDAAEVLAKHSIGAAPVVDDDGHVLGLLRDEDLIVSESNLHAPTWLTLFGVGVEVPGEQRHFEHELRRMVAATVQDLMTTEFATARPDDTLGTVAAQMHDRDVTHMPVIDDEEHLVGIVARGDLVRRVAAES